MFDIYGRGVDDGGVESGDEGAEIDRATAAVEHEQPVADDEVGDHGRVTGPS